MEETNKHRKVFISFLGTGNYLQTRYAIDGTPSSVVRFVQEALTDHICKNWSGNDRILIFYTDKSKDCNWLDGGQPRVQEDSEIENRGLKGILMSKSYASIVETLEERVLIPEGFSADEVWQIFDTVYSQLCDGDEVYFDVTHAFRSIPMFSTVLFNYAHFMKGIVLKQVCYGAFEKLGAVSDVKKIPINERVAPVLDLSNIIQLQNLTQIANGFLKYGKISGIGRTFELGSNSVLNKLITEFRKEVENLDNYILTNRIDLIERGEFAENILRIIKDIDEQTEMTRAQHDIVDRLKLHVSSFTANGGIQNIKAAVQWAIRYDMVQQAYTLAQESIISLTLLSISNQIPSLDNDKTRRQYVSGLLGISSGDKRKGNYKYPLDQDPAITKVLLESEPVSKLRQPFGIMTVNRNELSHGKPSQKTKEQFKKQLEDSYKRCLTLLSSSK